MKSFKIVNCILILSVVFIAKTAKATSLEFKFYKSETDAAMFVANDGKVENVKITGIGKSAWSELDVLYYESCANLNCLFTSYAMDSKINDFQIGYCIDSCISMFKVNNNKKLIGTNSYKLKRVLTTTKITLGGYVYNYNPDTKKGCLFTDIEMVESGMVADISDQLTSDCFSEKYGFGAYVYFGEVSPKNYYKKPIEGMLMNYYGIWKIEEGNYIFYVQEIQPFF
jgi:hypothetical protein